MIVFVINIGHVRTIELECDSPVATDRYSPCSFPFSLERVQPESRQVHILRARGSMQACQNQPDTFVMLGLDASRGPFGEEPLQATVSETPYHEVTVTRYVSGVKSFSFLWHNVLA